jgi:hypothetical protein
MKSKLLIILIATGISSCTFSQGYYMEFKMSSDRNMSGTMKAYSQNENSRSEIGVVVGAPNGNSPMNRTMVYLTLKDHPGKVISLNDQQKSYSEMDIPAESKEGDASDYEITVIGKEKVNGFNSTHSKIKNKTNNTEQEIWTTRDIPNYAELAKVKTKYTGKDNLNKALAAKDADGFPAKITVSEHGANIQLDLVSAEKRDNPSSLFSLDGYSKATSGQGGSQQQMMQQMQNMTPEERQKFIEQMKQQQQQGQPH